MNTDRASQILRIKREISEGSYDEAARIPSVAQRLAYAIGLTPVEGFDDYPLVHTGYTHDLPFPPPRRRLNTGGGVSPEGGDE